MKAAKFNVCNLLHCSAKISNANQYFSKVLKVNDDSKINQQLSKKENDLLRQRIQDLEKSESDLKQSKEALCRSEEKYRSIVETTAERIWEMDLTGRHTFSNRGVTAILGYSLEEFMGQSTFSSCMRRIGRWSKRHFCDS
ncbi:MAG: PAS domain S-box protein [Desulfobacterales bacterium]|nr:PAS domain S-box protein [Desulfobacterales bacterium]